MLPILRLRFCTHLKLKYVRIAYYRAVRVESNLEEKKDRKGGILFLVNKIVE